MGSKMKTRKTGRFLAGFLGGLLAVNAGAGNAAKNTGSFEFFPQAEAQVRRTPVPCSPIQRFPIVLGGGLQYPGMVFGGPFQYNYGFRGFFNYNYGFGWPFNYNYGLGTSYVVPFNFDAVYETPVATNDGSGIGGRGADASGGRFYSKKIFDGWSFPAAPAGNSGEGRLKQAEVEMGRQKNDIEALRGELEALKKAQTESRAPAEPKAPEYKADKLPDARQKNEKHVFDFFSQYDCRIFDNQKVGFAVEYINFLFGKTPVFSNLPPQYAAYQAGENETIRMRKMGEKNSSPLIDIAKYKEKNSGRQIGPVEYTDSLFSELIASGAIDETTKNHLKEVKKSVNFRLFTYPCGAK